MAPPRRRKVYRHVRVGRRDVVVARCLVAGVFLAVLAVTDAGAAAWTLQGAGADGTPARATVSASDGATLGVYRNAAGHVLMEFKTLIGGGLARTSCPTFQVDSRTPLHFYVVGQGCEIEGFRATYDVAILNGKRLVSLVLHRLMNGGQVAFRYLAQDGTYHESVFSLGRSKQALLAALGRTLVVEPGQDE